MYTRCLKTFKLCKSSFVLTGNANITYMFATVNPIEVQKYKWMNTREKRKPVNKT